jgi:hypothetical protein
VGFTQRSGEAQARVVRRRRPVGGGCSILRFWACEPHALVLIEPDGGPAPDQTCDNTRARDTERPGGRTKPAVAQERHWSSDFATLPYSRIER